VFETATPSADDPIVFNQVPVAFEEMMTWAIDLFDQADMELPPLRINHHGDDTSACEGRPGVRRDGDGHSVIDLCTDDVGFPTRALVLHELAHAWIAGNVGEAAGGRVRRVDRRSASQRLPRSVRSLRALRTSAV
jgi:hypothetical protein